MADEGLTLTADLLADAVVTAQANRLLLIALISFLQWSVIDGMEALREELPAGMSPELAETDSAAAALVARAIIDANLVLDGLEFEDDDAPKPTHPEPANDR